MLLAFYLACVQGGSIWYQKSYMFFLKVYAVPLCPCACIIWPIKRPHLSHLSLIPCNTKAQQTFNASSENTSCTTCSFFFIIAFFRGTKYLFNNLDTCVMYIFLATQICLVHIKPYTAWVCLIYSFNVIPHYIYFSMSKITVIYLLITIYREIFFSILKGLMTVGGKRGLDGGLVQNGGDDRK